MAQSVECPTLDFSLGHDPGVMGSSPALGLSLFLFAPLSRLLCLKQKIKIKKPVEIKIFFKGVVLPDIRKYL